MRYQSAGLNRHDLVNYSVRFRTLARVVAGVVLLALAASAFAAEPTEPVLEFNASTTTGAGSISPRLTWSTTPAATSCTASGHPSWTGTKAPSGAQDLPAITLSGTYTVTLSCTWAPDTSARLSWQAPTQYTDGSAIPVGALGPYRVYQGTTATNLAQVAEVTGLTTTRSGLATGTHYFAVSATAGGVESARSAVGSKVIGTATSRQRSMTLTVNPVPNAPVLTVE